MASVNNKLLDGVASLFQNSRYSDLVATCGDHEWKVHRNIVCTRCPFFASACDGEYKEAQSGHIALDDDYSLAVESMLRFLYTNDYDDFPYEMYEKEDRLPLVFNLRVHAVADKYLLPDLKAFAVAKFEKCAKKGLHNTEDWPIVIKSLCSPEVGEVGILRDITIREALVPYAHQLFTETAFREIFQELPDFALQLAMTLSEPISSKKTVDAEGFLGHECRNCARRFGLDPTDRRALGYHSCPFCQSGHLGSI